MRFAGLYEKNHCYAAGGCYGGIISTHIVHINKHKLKTFGSGILGFGFFGFGILGSGIVGIRTPGRFKYCC